MKVLLAILCGLMALFGGGCALALSQMEGALSFIPLVVLVFNGLVLAAIFGWKNPWKPAFYVLAVVDALVALVVGLAVLSWGTGDQFVFGWGAAIAAGFALKGLLTWRFVRSLGSPAGASP